ncbi:MAG TPA: hypothetical protein VH724_01595 [Candidatus Angelobacter sp.]|jgi:hypothetical protein|nr:hypothetical protein [Candidatus Angelobacter sp.]
MLARKKVRFIYTGRLMLKHRKLLILAILLIAVAAGAFFVYHRSSQSPEPARLLPEGDLILYANLRPVHLFDLGKSGTVQLEGDYKDFVDKTGIQFERDLDEVAMSRRDTADGRDVESSEIFIGRFDPARLKNYLQLLSSGTEQYRDHTIYSISHEGHMVRVALLEAGKVAATNMVSPEPMHGIIDRTFKSSSGPALLSHYSDVPLGSVAWLIDRISNKPDNVELPGGFAITLPADTVAVGSLRYTGSLLLRADVFAQSQAQAKQIVDSANAHLALVRGIGQFIKPKGADKDIKDAFDSIQVAQKENVAVFTATVPQSVLKKIWSEAQSDAANPTSRR